MAFRSPWTAHRKARFIDMWMKGEKVAVIALELGICEDTVCNAKRRFGLPKRHSGGPRESRRGCGLPSLSDRDTARAMRLWREGFGTLGIADQLGVSEASVYNSLSNARSQAHEERRLRLDAGENRDAEKAVG